MKTPSRDTSSGVLSQNTPISKVTAPLDTPRHISTSTHTPRCPYQTPSIPLDRLRRHPPLSAARPCCCVLRAVVSTAQRARAGSSSNWPLHASSRDQTHSRTAGSPHRLTDSAGNQSGDGQRETPGSDDGQRRTPGSDDGQRSFNRGEGGQGQIRPDVVRVSNKSKNKLIR